MGGLPSQMTAFGAQAATMHSAGMSIYTDPLGYILTNDYDAIIQAVLDKTVDAGFITTVYVDGTGQGGVLRDPKIVSRPSFAQGK